MKKLFFIIFATAIFSAIVPELFGQSAVYFCKETGAYGFAFGAPYKIVLDKAMNDCIGYGGTNPVLVASTEKKGFGAIALGRDSKGNRIIGAAVGFHTLEEAKIDAYRQCENSGGKEISISDTWNDN